MSKVFWTAFVLVFVAISSATWGLTSLSRYKPMNPKGVRRSMPHEEVVKLAAELRAPESRGLSRAAVDSTNYNFGMMDPGTRKSHRFVIRNAGSEPLKLGTPRPDCKCGTAELDAREIPPGEETGLNVAWDPGPEERELNLLVTVPTSDPNQSEIQFYIHGSVRQRLFADPILFTSIVSDSQAAGETVVGSQLWRNFTISDVQSSLPGLTWEIAPATEEQLRERQAQCAYRVAVRLPAGLPAGHFEETLSFVAAPSDESLPPETFTIAVEGKVQRLISIYGKAIDEDGLIDLGVVERGQERRVRLLLKVRDADKHLPNVRFECEPQCVSATLAPQASGVAGTYALEIVVPADASPCAHLREDQWGKLRMLTDHPRIPVQELMLRLAVAERSTPLP